MGVTLPSANTIPDKLINAKIYFEGKTELVGTADAELPALEYITETLSGLGLAGEIETPVLGHFKALPFKFKWNIPNEQAMTLLQPNTHHLEVFASTQSLDAATGKLVSSPVKIVLRGMPKKLSLGKLEPGKKMDPELELECSYIKMWIAGKVVLEIDKFNFIANIMGEDALGSVRKDLGGE